MRADGGAASHLRVTFEVDAWIRTARQQVSTEDALRATFSSRETAEEAAALYRLAQPVLARYERHLAETRCVDHEGTILKAWAQYLRDGVVTPPWSVILVDENQDVNPAQAAFVHALFKPRNAERPSSAARLTAVGDDWQAMFGFRAETSTSSADFTTPRKRTKARWSASSSSRPIASASRSRTRRDTS